MIATEEKQQTITTLNRCDRCNSQAWVIVKGINGELMFCSHHFNKHEEKLYDWAYDIVDDREFMV